MGHDWGPADAERVWDEVRTLSPVHAGMSYKRLEELSGLQWPCYDEQHPGEAFLHSRLWERPVVGPRAPFTPVEHRPPVDTLDDQFPFRLTTGRRLAEYNTGVQTGCVRVADAARRDDRHVARGRLAPGRRGRPVRARALASRTGRGARALDESLRPGLTFMTFHFPDDVATNLLTIDATDPRSGTAEFKAAAVAIERL